MLKMFRKAIVSARRDYDSGVSWLFVRFENIETGEVISEAYKPSHSLSRALSKFDERTMVQRLSGGSYLFHNGKLVNYRLSDYKGFVHDDESITRLADIIGVDVKRGNNLSKIIESPVQLGGMSESFSVGIKGLGDGGEFDVALNYSWSPFSDIIQCRTEMTRLICDNGMVGTGEVLTRGVRIINDWERNLGIVSMQMRPVITDYMVDKFSLAANERASVYEANLAGGAISSRLSGGVTPEEEAVLERLGSVLDYGSRAKIGNIKSVDSNAVTDISRYDVINVLTEAFSHTDGGWRNNKHIQGIINKILNRRPNVFNTVGQVQRYDGSCHSRAFFGDDY